MATTEKRLYKMERIILGEATVNTTSSYYSRSGKSGLFISKPGANVQNCSDGDLIFDSTSSGIVQAIGRGRATIPKQLYDRGVFGEVGVITEDNWNTGENNDELTSKTSWVFDAFTDLKNSDPTLPGIDSPAFVRQVIKYYWRLVDVFPFIADLPIISDNFYQYAIDDVIIKLPRSWHDAWEATDYDEGTALDPKYYPSKTAYGSTVVANQIYNFRWWYAWSTPGSPLSGEIGWIKFFKNILTYFQAITHINYTSTNNWGYTQWRNGEIDISTGVAPRGDRPLYVMWNSVTEGAGNTSTNLTFMDIREHVAKTKDIGERLTSLRPGVPTITANTYVENDEIKLKFIQPSTEDTGRVFYTIYRQTAWDGAVTSGAGAAGGGGVFTGSADVYSTSFAFNITGVNDSNYPGDNYTDRRDKDPSSPDYGKYYTVVFPDDFVQTKNTETDPFQYYRNSEGKISATMSITLNIPNGVTLSSNGHGNYIKVEHMLPGGFTGGTSAEYGPKDTFGRSSLVRDGAIDPCIYLNLSPSEWTEQALNGLRIIIQNNGTLVGGGGYGQYGQSNPTFQKIVSTVTQPVGGGGGGGAGYHPTWQTENPETDWIGSSNPDVTYDVTGGTYSGYIDTEAEKEMHRQEISTHWQGPNNYIEWGIGGLETANNYYSGMDKITMDTLAPGKPGTGYLGVTPEAPLTIYRWDTGRELNQDRPYSNTPYMNSLLELSDANGRYFQDLYVRLFGTWAVTADNVRRFGPVSRIGQYGTAGTSIGPGSGGQAATSESTGVAQDPWNRIDSSYKDIFGDAFGGYPGAGHGGSLVYLYSNTTTTDITGTVVQVINNPTGLMKSGGGGGSGGDGADGLAGGKLGRPGSIPPGIVSNLKDLEGLVANTNTGESETGNKGNYWEEYSRRGEPGRLVWWNTSNVQISYTIENKSTESSGAIEGLDYNSSINGWDYVSYLPDIVVTPAGGVATETQGQILWGREINPSGSLVYTDLNEQTYEEYLVNVLGVEL